MGPAAKLPMSPPSLAAYWDHRWTRRLHCQGPTQSTTSTQILRRFCSVNTCQCQPQPQTHRVRCTNQCHGVFRSAHHLHVRRVCFMLSRIFFLKFGGPHAMRQPVLIYQLSLEFQLESSCIGSSSPPSIPQQGQDHEWQGRARYAEGQPLLDCCKEAREPLLASPIPSGPAPLRLISTRQTRNSTRACYVSSAIHQLVFLETMFPERGTATGPHRA